MLGPDLDYSKQYAARLELQKAGVGYSEKEVAAQEALVQSLNAQLGVEERVSELKKIDSGNATTSTQAEASRTASERARQAADVQLRMGQEAIAADKATAQARLQITHASIQERLASEMEFAQRERDVQLAANQAQIAALDKMGKDYPNQLKAMQDKALEIQQQYTTQIAQLTAQAQTEQAAQSERGVEEQNRIAIEATRQGSLARLAAIDAAMAQEIDANMQETDGFRQLMSQRVETIRAMADQELQARLQSIEAASKVDEQNIASQYRIAQMELAARGGTIAEQEQLELEHENELYESELAGLNRELQALQQSGTAKIEEVQKTQAKIQALEQAHANQVNEIQAKADSEQTKQFHQAMAQMGTTAAQGFLSILEGHRSFASEMSSIASSLTQNLIAASIQRLAGQDSERMGDARTAAANVYSEVSGWPVVGPFLAPALAAGAFAAVMAFNSGTDSVPGVGAGDVVPAMLTPGEGVVPGGVMDNLRKLGQFGSQPQSTIHVHVRPTYHLQALDAAGFEKVITKHTNILTKHFHNEVRKLNR